MASAEEFARVAPGVFHWEAYELSVKTDLTACAVQTAEGLVFIDPIPLDPEAMEELLAEAPPAAVVVTSGNHWRSAPAFSRRFGIPLLAHAEAAAELGVSPDRLLQAGERICGELEVFELRGAGPGEIALFAPLGSLHFGDALINLPPYGFSILPEKYCEDAAALRIALRRLPALQPRLLTFAHGLPIVTGAAAQLTALVAAGA